MDTKTLRKVTDALVYGKTREEREAYRRQQVEAEQQWAEWLRTTYAPEFPVAQAGFFYAKAWEDGHASGYEEIENEYRDLVDFVRKFVTA